LQLPTCKAVSQRTVGRGTLPWLKANAPHAETFTIKRHMSFWSEPESFDAGLDAFLAKVR